MEKETKHIIKKAEDWKTIAAVVQGIPDKNFNSREYELIYRNLERTREGEDLKFAVLSNHTLDLLPTYVSVLCSQENLKLSSYVGPFNQYFQELLLDTSGLIQFNPDLIYLDLSISNLSPLIHQKFLELDADTKEAELNKVVETIENVAALALKNTDSYILLSNFVQPPYTQAGIADYKLDYSETEWYLKLNLKLIELFRKDNRIFILDKSRLTSKVGSESLSSAKMYYLAKMEFDEKGLQYLAQEILGYIIAIKGLTKKCLVLDLDNTLWGGVVGEDGVDGIKVGKGYPEGEVFYALQSYFKTLKNRGIILALASKNNLEDVEEAFKVKDDMPLQLEDFAISKINWEPKPHNMSDIAQTLNIGKDSMVFVDDNPAERSLMKDALPEVKCPELHNDPTSYLDTIRSSNCFEKLFITQDDVNKAEQYKQNFKRESLKQDVGDISAYLDNLGTELEIIKANSSHSQRIHQLFSKTNQFNVTTKRYDVSDIENFIDSSDYKIFVFSVKDNFGDLGIIGLVLLQEEKEKIIIDSFILSCRAMGRGVETAVMNILKEKIFRPNKAVNILSTYIPTQKNIPVQDFFDSQGFSLLKKNKDGIKFYTLGNDNIKLNNSPKIKIKLEM